MKVSIALCTYNSEKFISEQMDSLLSQTVLPDEIVISDDGSTDHTLDIIRSYQTNHKSLIKILNHPGHLGVFKNFPYALDHCEGDIIFPCDHDDVWMNDKIEKHLKAHLEHNDAILVYSNADVVYMTPDHYLYPLWEPKSILDDVNGQASYNSLVYKGHSIAGCCMSFQKKHYQSIVPFPDQIYHDDWLATTAVIKGKIVGIPESLIKYRQHGENTVGIIRGSRLSFYKSLFTNVKFYVESDQYITKRHELIFKALEEHKITSKSSNQELKACFELYQDRSLYLKRSLSETFVRLTKHWLNKDYRYHHGFWTYLKDLYNALFMKLLVRTESSSGNA